MDFTQKVGKKRKVIRV